MRAQSLSAKLPRMRARRVVAETVVLVASTHTVGSATKSELDTKICTDALKQHTEQSHGHVWERGQDSEAKAAAQHWNGDRRTLTQPAQTPEESSLQTFAKRQSVLVGTRQMTRAWRCKTSRQPKRIDWGHRPKISIPKHTHRPTPISHEFAESRIA